MIVTIVADVLGEENNGTTVACLNLVRYLISCKDTVRVVCCDKEKDGLENYYICPTLNLGCFLNWVIKKNNVSLAFPNKKILEAAIVGADIVHVMMPFALGKAAVKIAKKLGIPITAGFHAQAENFTSHIFMMNCVIANYLTYMNFYNKLYKKVDGIHYPTQFIRDLFEKTVRHKTNGYIISNGVKEVFKKKETTKPKELEDKFVILFTGRYSKEKSHSVLIKAVAQSRYKDSIQLIFAGQGPKREKIIKLAKRKKIIQPILGFVNQKELVEIINYSDLYCHPAEVEIEAIACLEAISCGLVPVIANSPRCATKGFALDEHNLFKCNSTKDLAEKIDFWVEHPRLKEEYSKKYLDNAIKLEQSECMRQMRGMLVETIEGKR